MQVLKNHTLRNLALVLFSSLAFAIPAKAATDLSAQENFAKMRAKSHQKGEDHAGHLAPIDKSLDFHGVFYGFLPCNDCLGIKMTLSLKQNKNYLLVIQHTKESSRETYEKGKYDWNDENHSLVLTPRKGTSKRHYLIENDEGTLIPLNEDGTRMVDQTDRHALQRSDAVKSREFHFH